VINSRNKGARFEREVAKAFRAVWPEARRRGGAQADGKGHEPDVDGTPFWVECKRTRNATRGQRMRWLQEAEAARDKHATEWRREVLLVVREDRGPATVHKSAGVWLHTALMTEFLALNWNP